MTAPAHWVLERFVAEAMNNVIREKVEPWLRMKENGVRVTRADGSEIGYEGIDFEGSPREVFWSAGYIDPFLMRTADIFIESASKKARDNQHDTGVVLVDVQGMLVSHAAKVYERMAIVDQRLRGKGYPDSVTKLDVSARLATFNAYVSTLVAAEHAIERTHARSILVGAAETAGSLIDKYSTWLMAGFAAFVALIVTNRDKVSDFISPGGVKVLLLFLAAIVVLGIAQKLLAVLVAGRGAGEAVGRRIAEQGPAAISVSVIAREVVGAVIWPLRNRVQKSLERVANGDVVSDARATFKFAQYQAVLAFLQTLLLLLTITWLIAELPGTAASPSAAAKAKHAQATDLKSQTRPGQSGPAPSAVSPRRH